MHDSSLIWTKFGERRTRDCIPEWRFEGRGTFFKTMRLATWNSGAPVRDVAFMNMHGELSIGNWNEWGLSTTSNYYGSQKCMSRMFIRKIFFRVSFNTFTQGFWFCIYKDEKLLEKLFELEPGISDYLFVSSNLRIGLAFDSSYAWALLTTDGATAASGTMSGSITAQIDMGAGDP